LKTIHWEAANKCKEFLNSLITATRHTKDKKQRKLILGLKHAEDTRNCFKAVRQFLKPITGGLTHVLIPQPLNQPPWEKAQDVPTMEAQLLKQGQVILAKPRVLHLQSHHFPSLCNMMD